MRPSVRKANRRYYPRRAMQGCPQQQLASQSDIWSWCQLHLEWFLETATIATRSYCDKRSIITRGDNIAHAWCRPAGGSRVNVVFKLRRNSSSAKGTTCNGFAAHARVDY